MKTCQMDCHACTIQDGFENKARCASLLLPAMVKKISGQMEELKASIEAKKPVELNPVSLEKSNYQSQNKPKNESIESSGTEKPV